ncbi:hypothetical protein DAEQUDRAFT_721773 [Daedalea quercina L-15889]|uniref:Peptidase M48 domain-containing protein n=1 Tax=Daedalea quercina L-15889 TaxID=1314783 RepID=A0A165TNE1_9APHY|nr:hypothetical protein DAEQUDRAFT_721773 [Daedalea quercina L-15889]
MLRPQFGSRVSSLLDLHVRHVSLRGGWRAGPGERAFHLQKAEARQLFPPRHSVIDAPRFEGKTSHDLGQRCERPRANLLPEARSDGISSRYTYSSQRNPRSLLRYRSLPSLAALSAEPQRSQTNAHLVPVCGLTLSSAQRHARAFHSGHARDTWPMVPTLRPTSSAELLSTVHLTSAAAPLHASARAFHSTPPRNGWPALSLLLSFLKTSSAIQLAGTVSRIALTFMPIALLNKLKSHKKLQKIDAKIKNGKESDELHQWRERVVERLRNSTRLFHFVLFTPIILFWLTIVASLERTPLTGRWRLILLSPDEEEDIAAQLAGAGWYRAVGEILTQNGTPRLIDPSDWRYQWVLSTLRRLENVIPVLSHEEELRPDWIDCGPDDIPQPPPAKYPLRPCPRACNYFRKFAEAARNRTAQTPAHIIPGPPYSLLVVDEPDSSNAFSYGFGPDGGGGIVVFSGFLEDVLRNNPHALVEEPQPTSWWSYLFGSFFGLAPRAPAHPVPTEEQTEELAVLLAHELAHLVLTHHIETLSTGTIIWPGVITIFTDIVRSFLFPVTMLFGPFINDALASVGKASSGEISHITEYYTSQSQEVEADIVSARLLAHAGFDPRHAIYFWEGRGETPKTAECTPGRAEERQREEDSALLALPRRWISSSHPMNVVRVQKLRQELDRWEEARRKAKEKREKERKQADAAVAAAE